MFRKRIAISKGAWMRHTICTIITSTFLCPLLAWATLPTGGEVVAGKADIGQAGGEMTITQQTARAAIDWQSFSIGKSNTVNFIQPSTDSVALNRVLGPDVSTIQGKLNANGHVFLINPNGVLFTPDAQVNVGGMVASTLGLTNERFLAEDYRFEGASSNAIVNQGRLVASPGGTLALVATKVTNLGSMEAENGSVLIGAGRRVALDLGGPVGIEVEQSALDALIEQGGAIRADGGLVYLAAKAANDLITTVINHTGVTEARTLATGEQGRIFLMGGFEQERVLVGGRIDASAPHGGDGGFIETSAAHVDFHEGRVITTAAASGETGTWLIDPNDFVIAASGGNITGTQLATDLASNNVSIATATQGTPSGNGDIFVNEAVSWSTNKLTLTAERNIEVNATLNATGAASLAFEYGQGTTDGAGSSYSVASGAQILIPAATAFTWKKGSAGATNNLIFNNGNLRFGNGSQASINSLGQLEQPWYFDNTSVVDSVSRNGWYKLTFSNYPLDLEVGLGGDGTNSWNRNGELHNTQNTLNTKITGLTLDISGYREGYGVVTSSLDLTYDSGDQINVSNTYTLDQSAAFIKTDTVLTNLSPTTPITNVRLWVGTRDDYVALNDRPTKRKGNLTASGFTDISAQNEQAKALRINEREDGQGASILFYSTNNDADTAIERCCSFTNVTGIDPQTSDIARIQEDGSYALFMRMNDLGANQSQSLTWYYAAAPAAQIDNVVTEVSESAGIPTTPSTPATPATPPAPDLTPAIANAQILPTEPSGSLANMPTPSTPPTTGALPASNHNQAATTSGSLVFVNVPLDEAPAESGDGQYADAAPDPAMVTANETGGGTDANGFMRVFVANGGVKLPDFVQNIVESGEQDIGR